MLAKKERVFPGGRGAEAKAWRREQGGPCSSHPRVLLRTPDESALPQGLPSLMGETFWGPDGCSL